MNTPSEVSSALPSLRPPLRGAGPPAWFWLWLLTGWLGRAWAGTAVIYPAAQSSLDPRHDDLIELVRSALEQTAREDGPYTMVPSKVAMSPSRVFVELQRGELVNITWGSTSVERERDFLPIRIPLRKGLLGYRLALIRQNQQPRFDAVNNLADLQKMAVGQGLGWGDGKLYQTNGFRVVSADYERLFAMVAAGRFDFFPRGLNEVFSEFDQRTRELPGLAVEQGLVLYYPWPEYCFFRRMDTQLAGRIERGLRRMLADGSYERWFEQWNGEWIKRARLQERRLIRLVNPFLPKETPLDDPALWYHPQVGK